jgi:hypothetical protein
VTDDTSETHFEPSTASRLQYSQQASRSDADTSSIITRQDEFEALMLNCGLRSVDAQLDSVNSTGANGRWSHASLLDLMGQRSDPRTVSMTKQGEKTRVVAPRRWPTGAQILHQLCGCIGRKDLDESNRSGHQCSLGESTDIPPPKTFGSQSSVAWLFGDAP